jgi:ATP-dependent protease ClpP protease subunit
MAKIEIKGDIIPTDYQKVYDWLGWEGTSPRKVNNEITKANGEDLEIEINSGGGDVFSGSEIYTALRSYSGNVTVKIVGIAASAASVIAMAGKKILMSPTAQLMIHNVSTGIQGDYRAMEHGAEVLKNANQTIANAYRLKTGLSNEKLLNMMNKETWFTPQQALDNNLIDEIMFGGQISLVNSYNKPMLSREAVNKISELIANPTNLNDKADFLLQQKNQNSINLLKLRGEIINEI